MEHSSIINNGKLTIPLYHGTSTLFLDSIVKYGLGGKNILDEWNLLSLSKEVFEICNKTIPDNYLFANRRFSFEQMINQNSGITNWQHGDTYLSSVKKTAISYAIHKKFGSELLTYTLENLQLLIDNKIPGVVDKLFRKYEDVFGLLDSSPSPLLIQLNNVPISSLLSESGEDSTSSLNRISEILSDDSDLFGILAQQINFRLSEPILLGNLKINLINIQKWDANNPRYNLYEFNIK